MNAIIEGLNDMPIEVIIASVAALILAVPMVYAVQKLNDRMRIRARIKKIR